MVVRDPHDVSIKIAHLTMLQGVIARMGSNSFALKTLSAAFASAAVAAVLTSSKPSAGYAVAVMVPIVMFWLMDAQYLRYERSYRKLYEEVRKGSSIEEYSLDAQPFMKDAGSILKIARSWSVAGFYVGMIAAVFIIAMIALHEK